MTFLFDYLELPGEIWENIPQYENLYEASSLGRIRSSLNKTTHTEKHGNRKWNQRILKPKGETIKTGYRVSLWKDGRPKDLLVARLVATTFLDNLIETNMTVNHKDGNRLNNNINNLEWVTLADNIKHAFNTGLMTTQIETVLVDTSLGVKKKYRSMSEASKKLGYKSGYISSCINSGKNTINDINGNQFIVFCDFSRREYGTTKHQPTLNKRC